MAKATKTTTETAAPQFDLDALWNAIPEKDPQEELKNSVRPCLHCGKPIVFETVESPVRDKAGNIVNHLNTDGSDSGVPCLKVTRIPRDLVKEQGVVTVDSKNGHNCPNRPNPASK